MTSLHLHARSLKKWCIGLIIGALLSGFLFSALMALMLLASAFACGVGIDTLEAIIEYEEQKEELRRAEDIHL